MLDQATGATFHSLHGAVQESMHIFIGHGLLTAFERFRDPVNVLEIGFGTGLNALLTIRETVRLHRSVIYTAVEKFPIERMLVDQLARHYTTSETEKRQFIDMHECAGSKCISWDDGSQFWKLQADLREFVPEVGAFHVIFFDAFGPSVVPDLWRVEVFRKLFHSLRPGGILLTFSVKGEVRRALAAADFVIEKLPGPPGKREITRATRNSGST